MNEASNATGSSNSNKSFSTTFKTIDRLVWFRHRDTTTDQSMIPNSTKDDNDDIDADDRVEWVPAIYYESFTEMILHYVKKHGTGSIQNMFQDPNLKRQITVQYIKEKADPSNSIPILKLLTVTSTRTSDSCSANNTTNHDPLIFRTIESKEDRRVQSNFFEHLIDMGHHQPPSSSSSSSLPLFSPQHLQDVCQLLEQEKQQEQQQESPPSSSVSPPVTTTALSHPTNDAVGRMKPDPSPPLPPPHHLQSRTTHRVSLEGGNTGDSTPQQPSLTPPPTMRATEIPATSENVSILNENTSDEDTGIANTNETADDDIHEDPTETFPIPIEPHDTIAAVKQKILQYGGWTYRYISVHPQVIYWIRPHCSVDTGRPNVDYFTTDTDLIQYLQSVYPHWRGNVPFEHDDDEDQDDEEDDDQSPTPIKRTQRRDSPPSKDYHRPTSTRALESDPEHNASEEDDEEESNVPSSAVENDTDDDDASDDENRRVVSDHISRKKSFAPLTASNHKTTKQPSAKSKGSTLKQKRVVSKVEAVKPIPKKKKQSYVTGMFTPKQGKKKTSPKKSSSPHWWKYENIPSVQQIRPILQALGFLYDPTTNQYQFPEHIRHPKRTLTMGYNALRKFLCCYGVPPPKLSQGTANQSQKRTSSSSSPWFIHLSEKQKEVMRRWIIFANVPIHGPKHMMKTKQELRNIGSPKKEAELISKLYTLGFSTVDGKLFVPEYKQMIDYQSNHKPIYGKHYFYKDNELYTKVRWYIRQSWHLGVDTMTDPDDDRLEQYENDQKRIKNNAKYYETLLFVRLWAAASSQPIPTFTNLPDDIYLEPYFHIPDDIEEQEVTDNEDVKDESSANDSDVSSSPMSEPSSVENADDDDDDHENDTPAILTSPETSVTSMESDYSSDNHDDDPKWYLYQPLPDFCRHIWPILYGKLCFHFRSGMYGHPDVPEPIGDSKAVQRFCVRYGIPNYDSNESLTEKERQVLLRWAAFAHVNVRQSHSIEELSTVKGLSEKQILELLLALKFQTIDDKIFVPGADYMVGGRSNRKKGVHYFVGMEGIRGYIRGAPDLCEPTATRKRSIKPNISPEDMLALRLWAARSDQPLPKFQKIKTEANVNTNHQKRIEVIDVDNDPLDVNASIDVVVNEPTVSVKNIEIDAEVPESISVVNVHSDGQNWHTPSQGSISSPSNLFMETTKEIDRPLLDVTMKINEPLEQLQIKAAESLNGTDNNIPPSDHEVLQVDTNEPFNEAAKPPFDHVELSVNETIQVDVEENDDQKIEDTGNNVKRDISLTTVEVVVPPPKRLKRKSVDCEKKSVLEKAGCPDDPDDDDILKVDRCNNHNLSTQDDDGSVDDIDEEIITQHSRSVGDDEDMEEGEVFEEKPKMQRHQLKLYTQFDAEDDDDDDDSMEQNHVSKLHSNDSTVLMTQADNPMECHEALYEPEDFNF